MDKRVWIGLLAAATFLGACAATGPGVAPQATADSDSRSMPAWSVSVDVPHPYLLNARKRFLGDGVHQNREEARNDLRLLVLYMWPRFVAENRAYMVRKGWQPQFIEEFDNIVVWRRRLEKDDGQQAYDLAREYVSQGGTDSSSDIGEELLDLAGKLGFLQGLLKYARIHIHGDTESDRSTGRHRLREVADLNFIPAQVEIAERYLEGRGFEPSKAKAIYWLGRAAMIDPEVAPKLRAADRDASLKDLVQVFEWFRTKSPPPE